MKLLPIALCALAATAALAAPGAAQLPPGTVYVASNFSPGQDGILPYDGAGVAKPVVKLANSSPSAIAMSAANDALLVWSANGIHRYDLATGAAVFTSLLGTNAWGCLDEDGGMVWLDTTGNGSVYRADDAVGTNTTLLWTDSVSGGFINTICWNGSDGSYVVGHWASGARDGRATFLSRTGVPTRTVKGLTFLSGADWSPWTGDVILSRFGSLVRIPQTGAPTTLAAGHIVTFTANAVEVLEQNTAAAERFLVAEFGSPPTFLSVIDGAGNVVTTLNSGAFGPSDCERVGSRPLWAANRWQRGALGRLNLNFGANRANDTYQVALSLGHMPGLRVGGGTLHLALDSLFLISAQNLIPQLFQNFAGTLDANGRANPAPAVAIPSLPALQNVRVYAGAIAYGTAGITAVSNCWGATLR